MPTHAISVFDVDGSGKSWALWTKPHNCSTLCHKLLTAINILKNTLSKERESNYMLRVEVSEEIKKLVERIKIIILILYGVSLCLLMPSVSSMLMAVVNLVVKMCPVKASTARNPAFQTISFVC